jgi:hypothetical protein
MNSSNSKEWLIFEYYCVNYHIQKYDQIVWHSSLIPEEELYLSGIVNDFNKLRI